MQSIADGQNQIKKLDPEVYVAVVIAGGDGTIHQLMSAIINCQVHVAIYPFGTANDLAGELGIRADWKDIQNNIIRERTRQIDLVKVNDSYFATVGGIGIGSKLTKKVNNLRSRSRTFQFLWKHLKSHMYSAVASKMVLTDKHIYQWLDVYCEEFEENLKVTSLFVANQNCLGKNLLIAPHAEIDDGLMHIVVLTMNDRFELMRLLVNAKKSRIFPANFRFKTKKLTLTSKDNSKIVVFGDGETILESSKVTFEVLPKKLQLVCPERT